MKDINIKGKYLVEYFVIFLKWVLISGIIGVIGGIVGSFFHISVEKVTELREENTWLIYLLPLAGLLVVAIYRIFKLEEKIGTNEVLKATRDGENTISLRLAPSIFLSTVITHMFGGSAGREGAALQLGGSIASFAAKIFKVEKKDIHLLFMCGMAAVFSALFSTPLTATFFAVEVISVGIMYYSALVPCLFASLVAYKISLIFGAVPLFYKIPIPPMNMESCIGVGILGALCALLSIIFCLVMHNGNHLLNKYIKNSYIRIFAGGVAVVLLTFLLGTYDYNGAGTHVIARAMSGEAKTEAFLLKILFTALTIGAGFRGGEIVPSFFIGSTFGCVVAVLVGLEPAFAAGIGLVAFFCGVVNCPVASIFLSVELFGSEGVLFFAIACVVSYLLSGYYGLYSEQKIIYSKLTDEYIDRYAK